MVKVRLATATRRGGALRALALWGARLGRIGVGRLIVALRLGHRGARRRRKIGSEGERRLRVGRVVDEALRTRAQVLETLELKRLGELLRFVLQRLKLRIAFSELCGEDSDGGVVHCLLLRQAAAEPCVLVEDCSQPSHAVP
jgi:hypothetical protein